MEFTQTLTGPVLIDTKLQTSLLPEGLVSAVRLIELPGRT